MPRTGRTAQSGEVEIELDGEKYRGHYSVTGGPAPKLRVSAAGPWLAGFRVAPVGILGVEDLARALLRQIVTVATRQRLKREP